MSGHPVAFQRTGAARRAWACGFMLMAAFCGGLTSAVAQQTPEAAHGLAMHGEPALDPDYAHFSYADPNAPVGGKIALGGLGGFDSLNPFAQTGRAPWHVRWAVFESLLVRSWDEPFTLYGLLAERVATPPDRSYVEFFLNPKARFSNGDPVTVEDVIFTWEKLKTEGRANLQTYYGLVERAEQTGPHSVRFVFKEPNRELPLLMGLMPILPKSVYGDRDFAKGDLITPVGSGPYVIVSAEPGSLVRYRRNPDYWGWGIPANAGRHNFEAIDFVYFSSDALLFEGLIGGEIDLYDDLDPARWVDGYDVPAVRDGRLLKVEIPRSLPSGMYGFVFNTRRALFEDRNVRIAISLAFDFVWANERYFRSGYTRIGSTFSGSPLGFDGPATGEEAALLEPYAKMLPKGTLERGYVAPEGAGDGRNRRNLRIARKLLEDAGWRLMDGVLVNAEGRPFAFEILLENTEQERIAKVLQDALKALGIEMTLRNIDSAQYAERIGVYDYDMMMRRWGVSLSPGEEQRYYWGSSGRETPRTRNYMGANDPVVDAMIDALLKAENREDFEAAVRALDRVLNAGVYVIPLGYLPESRIAHDAGLGRPEKMSIYGYVFIDTWWRKPE